MTLMFLEFFFFLTLCVVVVLQQPLSLGAMLLFLCFLISVYLTVFFSSWFSFSLFLIYIGGMLVLFGYVLVLVPNFVFSFKGVSVVGGLVFFFFFFF